MLLEKIKAKSQRGWRSLTRIFASRSSQPEQPEQPSRRPRVDGRLFVLPYDLLEEIATYFSHQEAAPLLTVNSQFHDAFARAVWRRLDLDDDRVDRISASAWETYGHLVRIGIVDFGKLHEHLDVVRMPNVIDLTLYLTYRGYNIFEDAELNNLRRLHLNLPWYGWTSFAAVKGAELAQRLERSGHPLEVDWDIHAEKHKQVAAIDEILAPITNMSPHSFTIAADSNQPVTLEQLPKLAEMLTELDVYSSRFGYDCFLRDPGITFPRLVKLTIGSSCFDEEGNDGLAGVGALNPDRFPVLQCLCLFNLSPYDLEWPKMLFTHDWKSVTDLVFHNVGAASAYVIIARSVPNLKRLSVKGFCDMIYMYQVIVHMSSLQQLEVGSSVRFDYHASNGPNLQLASLKSFIINPTWDKDRSFIHSPILDFILHGAPNLESIELNDSSVEGNVLYKARGHVNPSVRTLGIQIGSNRFDAVTAKTFIGMFPNLKLLKVKSKDDTASQQLKGDHPNLRIQFYQ
ncbi:hypothetical protein GQ42DRAFT_164416 [Ramicandelaber brevisporus]|nr:hypothetical protein GQ42DRAFT_164416 [Ramicandelaber brevisporus]